MPKSDQLGGPADDEGFIARYGREVYDVMINEKMADGSTPDWIMSWEDETGERRWNPVKVLPGPSQPIDSRPPYKKLKIRNVYTLYPAKPTESAPADQAAP